MGVGTLGLPVGAADGSSGDSPAESADGGEPKGQATNTGTDKRVRDLQSKADKAEAERQTLASRLEGRDSEWLAWAQRNLSADKWQQIETMMAAKGQSEVATKAQRADSIALVNGLYREGDLDFAKFVDKFVDIGHAITTSNIKKYREMFDDMKPAAAAATPAKDESKTDRRAPRVASSGGSPSSASTSGAAFKGGTNVVSALTEAFRSRR